MATFLLQLACLRRSAFRLGAQLWLWLDGQRVRLQRGRQDSVQVAYRRFLAAKPRQAKLTLRCGLRVEDLVLSVLAGNNTLAERACSVALILWAYLPSSPGVLLRPHFDVADQG